MSRLVVAAIIEGHGEQAAIRILIRRIWTELLGGEYVEVLHPIRRPRSKLVQRDGLLKAIDLAELNVEEKTSNERSMILVLLDADEDLPCILAPALLEIVREERSHLDVAVVLANEEYETWFVAAAESLQLYLELRPEDVPEDPEATGAKKAWVQDHYRRTTAEPSVYTETVDQPAMTATMDLHLCRSRSRSFDKLCRELAKRLDASSGG